MLLPNLQMTTGTQEIHKLTMKGIIAQRTVKKHKTFNTNNNRIKWLPIILSNTQPMGFGTTN